MSKSIKARYMYMFYKTEFEKEGLSKFETAKYCAEYADLFPSSPFDTRLLMRWAGLTDGEIDQGFGIKRLAYNVLMPKTNTIRPIFKYKTEEERDER